MVKLTQAYHILVTQHTSDISSVSTPLSNIPNNPKEESIFLTGRNRERNQADIGGSLLLIDRWVKEEKGTEQERGTPIAYMRRFTAFLVTSYFLNNHSLSSR